MQIITHLLLFIWIMLLQPPESFLGAMEEYIKNAPRHNMVQFLHK